MKVTTLTGLRIWDGQSQLDADAIRIEGSTITAVGDAGDLSTDAELINYSGATAIPGLIDAHVHMVLDPEQRHPPGRDDQPDMAAMRQRARAMVQAGITTARDLGGGHWRELELRDDIANGATEGPRLLCAGQPVTSTGGHCHFWGGEANNIEAINTVIDRQLEHRVDLIKVMATGGRMTSGSQPLEPQFSLQALQQIVARAEQAGLGVAAHCHGTAGIEAAAIAGVSTIEHCSWVGKDGWASDYQTPVAQLIAERHVQISPTVNAGWRRMLGNTTGERVSRALQDMIARGIGIIASTDAGIPGVFHHDLPRALDVFQQLTGTSNEFTLSTATSHSAQSLGLSQITGRIAKGLNADLLIVDGNPLTDLKDLCHPVAVWIRGRLGSGFVS
jgi:imidazolonepropionase-like amidohydrolase